MPFSEEQIEQLYTFTKIHFVEHYDLQTELVDHLANGIESQQSINPSLTFEHALKLEFKKFGVCGFNDIIQEKTKAMSKRYRTLLWRFFKEWFKWPKALLTMTLIGFQCVMLDLLKDADMKYNVCMGTLFFLVLFTMYYMFKTKRTRELLMNQGGKKWILGEIIYNYGWITSFLLIPAQLMTMTNHWVEVANTFWFQFFYALLVTTLVLLSYVVIKVLPEKAEELLQETYPEYKLS
jgi:hypothetical protein